MGFFFELFPFLESRTISTIPLPLTPAVFNLFGLWNLNTNFLYSVDPLISWTTKGSMDPRLGTTALPPWKRFVTFERPLRVRNNLTHTFPMSLQSSDRISRLLMRLEWSAISADTFCRTELNSSTFCSNTSRSPRKPGNSADTSRS